MYVYLEVSCPDFSGPYSQISVRKIAALDILELINGFFLKAWILFILRHWQ